MVLCALAAASAGVLVPVMDSFSRQGKGVGDFRPLGVRPSGLGVLHFFSEFLHRLIIRKLALGYVLPGSDITEIIDVAGNLVL